MTMHNPSHRGQFVREVYLGPLDLSARQFAARLCVSPSTLGGVLQGRSGVSPGMALRLFGTLDCPPDSWLAMQERRDLWCARKSGRPEHLQRIMPFDEQDDDSQPSAPPHH